MVYLLNRFLNMVILLDIFVFFNYYFEKIYSFLRVFYNRAKKLPCFPLLP